VSANRGAIEKRVDAFRLADRLGSGVAKQRLGQLREESLDALRVWTVAEVFVSEER
jgi:hypothetical protein